MTLREELGYRGTSMRPTSFSANRSTTPCGVLLGCAALLWTACAQGAAAQTTTQSEVQARFTAGATAMQASHPEQAEREFRQVTELAPNLAEGHLELGLAEVRTGKLEPATHEIERALTLKPGMPNANLFLGITYHQLNRTGPAIAAVQRELDLNRDNAEALLWMGILQLAKGDAQAAIAPLDRAAQLAPKDPNTMDYRGRAHMLVAKESYRTMYELDPHSWRVYRLQGQMDEDAFKYNDAAAQFEKAIAIAPGQADLYESLGREYQRLNRMELAAQTYKKELTLNPADAVALYDLGSVEVERGNAREGVPLLQKAIAASPDAAVAYYYLGRGQEALGDNPAAIAAYEHVVQAAPGSETAERAYYQLGHVYRTLGKTAEARNALQKFGELKQRIDSEQERSNEFWNKPLDAPEKRDTATGLTGDPVATPH